MSFFEIRMIKKVLIIIVLFMISQNVNGNFPDNLDAFLGLLFDTEACENFVANADYLGVATRKCDPYTCDFPHEMCMRPSALYKEEKANQCRSIPEKCLIAANNGMPLPPKKSFTTLPPIINPIPQSTSPPIRIVPPKSKTLLPKTRVNVCRLEIAQGRFCGFKQMWFWNKEHKMCEQFWFPGCVTKDTNGNLFENQDQCLEATKHCKEELAKKNVTPAPITNGNKVTRQNKNKFIETTSSSGPIDPREYGGNAIVGGKAVKQNNLLGLISNALKPKQGGKKKGGKGNNMGGNLATLGALGSLAQLGGSGNGPGGMLQSLIGGMTGMNGNRNGFGGGGGGGGAGGIAQQFLSNMNLGAFLG
ncbi:Proteinase inhibitor I2, Kunitz metazoa domain-containing protein [Strongyloides ratti]|uniref:Proteinase inhibitor I2, Kunitz metazoa domain-containing protein n=1 Tax=Strongyloides ratti TaxID=34506 RepID=A0A090MVW0_STRRB|nr:Proteinase inhibitor I2, Kunitz metazoa domain-containing protein [Strongyloides ratti]CEF63158.1 Proteinase inhibitor I2, Kunitz metazoa domain-containing protein [Strongyloides ratti]